MHTTTRKPESLIDYDACRKRLRAITTDAAALASFERVAQSGEVGTTSSTNIIALSVRSQVASH